MANVKIPYALTPAVAIPVRRENMKHAIARGLPRLDRQPPKPATPCYIAAFGPSLRETFEELRDKHPLITMSGSTKWLAERGIIADYALEMDPRERKTMTSLPPVPGVTYLIASVVAPIYFDEVVKAGNPIRLWHTVSTNWEDESNFVSQHDPGQLVVHGGSTIGLTAIHIGGLLGYSRFEIHGMDGSFAADGERHAGLHLGKSQADDVTWKANGKVYKTSRIMANAVAETINTAKNFPIITVWHGDGLTQGRIRKSNLANACCADETEKRARLKTLQPRIIPASLTPGGGQFWPDLISQLAPTDLPELVGHIPICEGYRLKGPYLTGTVSFESAVYLRAICRLVRPNVIAEVGTFMGTSTLALSAGRVLYTCDKDNDLVPAVLSNEVPNRITHPKQTSTEMLKNMQEPVDLFFFDGRILSDDLPEILRLSHPRTVYVFHDYADGQKGQYNAARMRQLFPTATLMPPVPNGPSTLAVLFKAAATVPEKVTPQMRELAHA